MPLRASTSPAWRQHLPFSFATTFHHVPCDIEYDSSAERDSFLLWHRAFPTPALVGIPNDRKLSWSKSFKMNCQFVGLAGGTEKITIFDSSCAPPWSGSILVSVLQRKK